MPKSKENSKYGPNYDEDEDPNAPIHSWRAPLSQILLWGILPGIAAVVLSMAVSQFVFGAGPEVREYIVAPIVFFVVGGSAFYYVAYVLSDEWNEFDPDYREGEFL